ncbi:PAS and ANTAR domain-containing protein [Rhodococcus maanshanensis]|uniref:histidine kinase n=1 Tax=Rhodococcus maanshanensis TaxID=183556 RepID=A0A1H7LQQ6_9NOCA|nr:PAS and ANTAR domain-containing protein [Rhodococcus maanshanensis]SEL01219.1 PAS domain S-box-containing protein [Rhodococcus maanshanensis]
MSGRLERVGSFRFYFNGERWEWSDAVARMHGYEPGEVFPTTELLLEHKHPEDRDGVADLLRRVLHEGEPFSSRHRIIDTDGNVRHVVVVGQRIMVDGQVIGTSGFYIDVTNSVHRDIDRTIAERLPELVESRAVIEQAKGALMVIYGVDADRAFEVLTWCSQESNVKLRVIAEQLVSALPTAVDLPNNVRSQFDHILLTRGTT